MKKAALAVVILIASYIAALAQNATVVGPVTPGDCAMFNSPTVIKDGGFPCPGSGGTLNLPNGTTATTQAPADNTTKVATDAYVENEISRNSTHFSAGGTTTGSANAQVISTVSPPVFSLTGNPTVTFIAGFSNTGATTLNVASSGIINILKKTPGGLVALVTGDVISGQQYLVTYDGTQYELQTPSQVVNSQQQSGAANTLKGSLNGTAEVDTAVPNCLGAGSALQWTSGVGLSCGTSAAGRTVLNTNTTFFLRTTPVAVTISNASPAVVTHTAHGYSAGQTVTFNSTSSLPTGMTAGTVYFVLAAGLATNTYEFSLTNGGAAINTSSAGAGTFTEQAGNDSANGSAATATGSFMTLQGAANYLAQNVDTGGTTVTATVQAACAGGGGVALYSTGVQMLIPFVGSGRVDFKGDTTTPSNCVVSVNAAANFQATYSGTAYQVEGFKLVNAAASGNGIYSSAGATVITGNMEFGVIGVAGTSGVQLLANTGNIINIGTAWTVSGGSGQHLKSQYGGHIENAAAVTVTVTGTPAFANTALAQTVSNMNVASMTYSGACTGQRFAATNNADIETGGGGANYFCGNVAGGVATGGIYN